MKNYDFEEFRCLNCNSLIFKASKKCSFMALDGKETNYGINLNYDVEIKCKKCNKYLWLIIDKKNIKNF